MRALVWLKRDLRAQDHAPLAAAQAADEALALYVIEPEWLAGGDFDAQHLAFALACLAPLRADLAARGLPLLVRVGPMLQVLDELRSAFAFSHLLSHEETGSGWTYQRDLAVGRWCRARGVAWTEYPQTGVVRRLKSRSGWAASWARRMDAPALQLLGGWRAPNGLAQWSGRQADLHDLPDLQASSTWQGLSAAADFAKGPVRPVPAGGEVAAHAVLQDFLGGRALGYRKSLSSPLSAEQGCSRLSAHLAFGTLSMRQVHQATEAAIARPSLTPDHKSAHKSAHTADYTPDRALAHDLRGFAGRLRWHCHFMQKLEDEPEIEFRNFSRAHDGLREQQFDAERFEAWCEGRTGYPMVDACMRQLRATGWLNFRMRAMLVSFAAYHLWLHWRLPGQFLARQFLDFEPGIHWSQMQMQSGTTGINTLRIYSPAKQAREHDPDGSYVRRWVPEFGTAAYPAPIVEERAAVTAAKQALYGLRASSETQQEAQAIQQRHGSRKSGLPPSSVQQRRSTRAVNPVDERQGSLFD